MERNNIYRATSTLLSGTEECFVSGRFARSRDSLTETRRAATVPIRRIGCQKLGTTQGTNNITQGKVMVSPSNLCLKNNLPQAHMESPQFPLQDKQRSGISSMVDQPYQRHKIISNIRWENIELANGNLLPATTPSRRLAGQLRPLPGGWHEEPDVRGFRGWGNQYARHPMGQGCSRRNLCA
ncbi:hypothetical protein Bbelb_237900 [Branchiostoma belcheri]|nr:hypothetical protein Bbelb_237900 [Branchiostoma belcheri]